MGSGRLTNEDNFAVRGLADKIGADKIYLMQPQKDAKPFGPSDAPLPEWFIREDKSPNYRGAKDMLGEVRGLDRLMEDIKSGQIKGLLVFGADPVAAAPGGKSGFQKLDWMAVVDTHATKTTAAAALVFVEATSFEKEGSFTNEGARLQRIAQVIPPVGDACSTWQTVSAIVEALDGTAGYASAGEVFDAIAKSVPLYKNITLPHIGALGISVRKSEGE
jgi:formate dehydrogenase major subunit